MKIEELQSINRTIKAETLRYCRGMIPSLDEVGELTIILAAKTRDMVANPHKINLTSWLDVVYNSIAQVISTNVL